MTTIISKQKTVVSRVLKNLTCQAPNRYVYHAQISYDREYLERFNKDKFVVRCSQDEGKTWTELPLQLDCWSRLINWHDRTWPPEKMDCLFYENNQLVLEYRDPWVMHCKPFMPFGLDRESQWRAFYDPARQLWRLLRVRRLDYENRKDVPPV